MIDAVNYLNVSKTGNEAISARAGGVGLRKPNNHQETRTFKKNQRAIKNLTHYQSIVYYKSISTLEST